MKVQAPDLTVWRVSRRWLPWRRRVKDTTDRLPDVPEGGIGDDPISMVLGLILLILLLPFLLLMLLAGIELLLLLLLLPFVIAGRILLGRSWTVEVRRGWRPYWEEPAGDWQQSGLRVHEVAEQLRLGSPLPQTLGAAPPQDDEDDDED